MARFLCNYDPSINFVVKELSHGLVQPNEADWDRLRRFGKFLVGHVDVGIYFHSPAADSETLEVDATTDSDWASTAEVVYAS